MTGTKPGSKTIQITLPNFLADFLMEISKETAMKPDQLIAYILTLYYEVWKIGKESKCIEY